LLQIQRVRSRIATDLHDDIGSTLTNINILSELSKKNIDNRPEAEKFLSRISEEVNASGQALDDIVWSINKNNDTIEQTVARMRRYAAEMFEGANITYSLQSDEQIAHRKLNMELRRDYFLLFKESINNIYKHARAKNVQIKVWVERSRLLLLIRDDGGGFNVQTETHRNGIKNMHTRAEKWKGSVNIHSEPGKGTSTEISLPIS
jgi:signal transduction histidine kinase